jgi:hypothetical protein
MSLKFELKKVICLWSLASVCALLCFIGARADELHLKDGRVIAAELIWESGDTVWYQQGKIIASVAKAEVVRIAKPKPASVPETSAAALNSTTKNTLPNTAKPVVKSAAPLAPPTKSEDGDESATRKVVRILLKGGAQIDADSVLEDSERVGYRLGKMQSFVERAEVVRVVRELEVSEASVPVPVPPTSAPLRYSTGHRGLDNLILYSAYRHKVDPLLIYLIMRQESSFNIRAVSRVGARGLMQLMPGTAAQFGVRNIHDPVENVEAGTRYLRKLLEMFNGDMNLTLAAYNAGEGAVLKYGRRVPPYRETMDYVWKINTAYRRALADASKESRSDLQN